MAAVSSRRRPGRGRRVRRATARAAAVLAALALAVGAVVVALNLLTSVRVSGTCIAEVAGGGTVALDADQADNAALFSAVAHHRGLPARATTIAIATALQESKLRNIDYGDRDSVGLFQQRPSQGWGTVEEIMDPVYATNAFYDVLVTVEGWESQEITDAAQRVQRSGFPEAYAQHEDRGRAFASALSGYSPASLTCRLGEPEGDAGTPAQRLAPITDRLSRDFTDVAVTVDPGGVLLVDATSLPGGLDPAPERLGWAVAQWAVATAGETGASVVSFAGEAWVRADGNDATWRPLAEADVPQAVAAAAAEAAPGVVVVA